MTLSDLPETLTFKSFKGAKASKSKSKPAAKKKLVKKSLVKKGKPAKKVEKVPLKQNLDAKDVSQILKVKDLVIQQKNVLSELESRGITNIHRIVKKADQDLVLIARELEATVPKQVEKLRKAGLGSPYRMLKKTELALVAPPAPKPSAAASGKGEKIAKVKIDGEEVELEEVELEDLENLIDDKEEAPVKTPVKTPTKPDRKSPYQPKHQPAPKAELPDFLKFKNLNIQFRDENED